jgi:hypothetical protein
MRRWSLYQIDKARFEAVIVNGQFVVGSDHASGEPTNFPEPRLAMLTPCLHWFVKGISRFCTSGFIIVCSLNPGYSGLVVEGTESKLLVDVKDAALSDVFQALQRNFNLRLKAPINPDISINGHFAGSLSYVVKRLLQGYDFVLATRQVGGIETIVIIPLGHNPAAGSSAASWVPPDPQLLPSRNDGFQ